MIRIIISIYPIQPPTKRQTVHHIIGMPHFTPGITTHTPGIGILIREKRSNRFYDKHIITAALAQMLHSVIESLCAGGNVFIVILIGFHHTSSQKIEFEILKTGSLELINEKVNPRQRSRSCRIHATGTIQFPFLPIHFQMRLTILVTIIAFNIPFIVGKPVIEWRPINSRYLPISNTMPGKIFELFPIQIVPVRVQAYKHNSIRTKTTFTL